MCLCQPPSPGLPEHLLVAAQWCLSGPLCHPAPPLAVPRVSSHTRASEWTLTAFRCHVGLHRVRVGGSLGSDAWVVFRCRALSRQSRRSRYSQACGHAAARWFSRGRSASAEPWSPALPAPGTSAPGGLAPGDGGALGRRLQTPMQLRCPPAARLRLCGPGPVRCPGVGAPAAEDMLAVTSAGKESGCRSTR